MKEKVLITGSNGLLGQKLVTLFLKNQKYEVFALSRGVNRNSVTVGYVYYDVDATDFNRLNTVLTEVQPSVILNAAAMTNVDECEEKRSECHLINVALVAQLVNWSAQNDAHLIHISTDFIFDGKNGPYREDDVPNPLGYYGQTKLESEELLIKSTISHTILRTILVYGIVDNMSRSNIVLWIKGAIENKKEVTIIDDQFRMPTLVDDLAQACLLAVEKRAQGVFNVSSNTLLSIYEIAFEVAKVFDLDSSYIKRISTKQLNQRAERPSITGFILDKSVEKLGLPSYSFTERLQVFKNQLLTIKS